MKTRGPLILGFLAGMVAFGELYVPAPEYRAVFEYMRNVAQILTSLAFILGGINVVQVNLPKIRRREDDWYYKVVMLVAAAVMSVAGIRWHLVGSDEASSGSLEVVGAAGDGPARLELRSADKDAVIVVDGKQPMRAWHSGDPGAIHEAPGSQPFAMELAPGMHTIAVQMPTSGYATYARSIWVGTGVPDSPSYTLRKEWSETHAALAPLVPVLATPGSTVNVNTDLVMYWGAQAPRGRVFNWLYDYVFKPCNQTMFALLAFFIASAAFRAFRARNTESALLLAAAILVMIGLVPIGRAMSPIFPEIQEWIMSVLNTTGRRAIMMGAALGAIATGLRVILGIERSHLGQD